MNVEYTAAMELELDEIEEGKDTFLNTLSKFWKKFERDLKKASKEMQDLKGLEEKTDEVCEKCGSGMVLKWGRYGKFLACSTYPECKNTRQVANGTSGGELEMEEEVAKEVCPRDGQAMVLKKGRFGPFLACINYPECKSTKRLVRGENGKLEVEKLAPIDEACPVCTKPLMWRRGRFGTFIACSDYPTCTYIKKNEPRDIGMQCPECGEGRVVERKGRWGRFFYGCSRYPQCRFTAQNQPIAEPCPECGKAFVLEKETKREGRFLFCGNEGCSFKRSLAESESEAPPVATAGGGS
jgi:DNA topoisomerase-1